MPPIPTLLRPATRRQVLTGVGAALAFGLQPAALADDGFRVLTARTGTAALRGPDQPPAAIWGYDGTVPGPTLRVRRDSEVKVRLLNQLPEPTLIHWHGVRLPNALGGVPHLTGDQIPTEGAFDYRFRAVDAGTFWYHAPAAEQAGRGLRGVLIVDEPEPLPVDQDVVLMLEDWAEGITANGLPSLDIPVRANERVRLRLVNAAMARMLTVRLDGQACRVMAVDGQPAEPFQARQMALGPGNRVDLFLDATLPPGAIAPLTIDGVERPIARLVYASDPPVRPAPRPPATTLPPNPLPALMDFRGALRVEVPLGAGPDGNRLFSVKRGRTVMLNLANRTDAAFAVHLHGHSFRLLDRLDDGWKPFWLDTIAVGPQDTTRIAFVADNPGQWRLDRARLAHSQAGPAAWFEVAS